MRRDSHEDFVPGIAVILGGSGGIGRAIATGMADAGTDVVITYRSNQEAARAVTAEVEKLGRRASALELDISDRAGVQAFFSKVAERVGPIHTVVNATGTTISLKYVGQLSPADWDEVMRNDVDGFFNIVHASLPLLRKSGGSYVNVTTAGLRRWPMKDVLSVVPKAAIQALVTGIAREEGRYGVRANSVALGLIDAGLFLRLKNEGFDDTYIKSSLANMAIKRLGTADEVADAVVFLASDRARYLTGQVLALDGGFSL